jgi:hypothetical protein
MVAHPAKHMLSKLMNAGYQLVASTQKWDSPGDDA